MNKDMYILTFRFIDRAGRAVYAINEMAPSQNEECFREIGTLRVGANKPELTLYEPAQHLKIKESHVQSGGTG